MPKINKITDRAFADIVKSPIHDDSTTNFLSIDKELGLDECELLKSLKDQYKKLVDDVYEPISVLAHIEEIIIQIRAKQVIDKDLRLSLSRNYIYARSTFYRRDNQINDIRVLIGKTSDFGDDLDLLLNDDIFRLICKKKLTEAMNREIKNNVEKLSLIINEYKTA